MTTRYQVKFTEFKPQPDGKLKMSVWFSEMDFEFMSEAVAHGILICRLWPRKNGAYLQADAVPVVQPCVIDECIIDAAIASDAANRHEARVAAGN